MIDYSLRSDIGGRKNNEDFAVFARRKDGIMIFVIADGLGGHGRGDRASKFVAEFIKDRFLKEEIIDSDFIEKSFFAAQEALLKEKEEFENSETMLTTAAVLVVDDKCFQFGNIGDSRIYVFKDGIAKLRTADHSIPQLLFEKGDITEEEIRSHPDRNKIVCALGISNEDFDYYVSEVMEYNDSNAFILCTDGFWEYVLEEDMEKTLSESKDAASWQKAMTKIVYKNRTRSNLDNYTSIVIKA